MPTLQCPVCQTQQDSEPYSQSRICTSCKSLLRVEFLALSHEASSGETYQVPREDVLGKIGVPAPSAAPFALGHVGTQDGEKFQLTGRVTVQRTQGETWEEWHGFFADSTPAVLVEAQGRRYLLKPRPEAGSKDASELAPGSVWQPSGGLPRLTVSERGEAQYIAAEGEFPFVLELQKRFAFIDLQGEQCFASIAYDDTSTTPLLYLGREYIAQDLGFTSRDTAAQEQADKDWRCSICDSPQLLRTPETTQAISCLQCNTISYVDNNQLITHCRQAERPDFTLPLGIQGNIENHLYTIVGVLRRQVVVAGIVYPWDEYLLHSPTVGYRWLVESEKHWSFVEPVEKTVDILSSSARYEGETYKKVQQNEASIAYVYGEVYWKLSPNDAVTATDYIAPPFMLSSEQDSDEIVWSKSYYLTKTQVEEAFGKVFSLPRPNTMGIIQPNKVRNLFVNLCWAALFWGIANIVSCISSAGAPVHAFSYTLSPKQATTDANQVFFSEPFSLQGDINTYVKLDLSGIEQSWAYVAVDVFNEQTGQLQTFDAELSYYHGVDGGESWSEGSRDQNQYLPTMPAGQYVLRVEAMREAVSETGFLGNNNTSSLTLSGELYQDVSHTPSYTFWFALFVGAAVLLGFAYFSVEKKRSSDNGIGES